MTAQIIAMQEEMIQVCESIFETGSYFPRSMDETNLLQTLGFDLQQGSFALPIDIEYLDQSFIEKELRANGVSCLNQVLVKNCVGSTNKELLCAAQHSDIANTVLFAELQIAGCGRYGRSWQSPVGRNLALSLGVRARRTPEIPDTVSLVVGVAVACTLVELGIGVVSLKWPNDILLEGQKVGGILVDIVDVSNPLELVVGIGLNVGGKTLVQEIVGHPVADILDYGSFPLRNTFAVSIVRNVYESLQCLETDGFQSFYRIWTELDALNGEQIEVSTLHESYRGIARGITNVGELCIELENGEIHHVIAGEVSLR